MFCCTLLYVNSSIAIILMGKREHVALLNLSSWCLVMVERLFLAVPRGCLQFVIVVFLDHTHLLFLTHVVRLKRKPQLYTVIGFKTRHAACRMTSKQYSTFFITLDNLFKFITKIRFSNNSFEFINQITIKYNTF